MPQITWHCGRLEGVAKYAPSADTQLMADGGDDAFFVMWGLTDLVDPTWLGQ